MARPRTRRNAGGASIDDSGTPVSTPAIICALTPAPAQTHAPAQALAPAPTSVPGPSGRYMDEELQRATKLAIELFVKGQEHGQLQVSTAPRDRPFKARNPDFYYGGSHMECFYFCRQCEDYFNTVGATGHKRVPFAALFL